MKSSQFGRVIDHPRLAEAVGDHLAAQAPPADDSQQTMHLVNGQYARRRVVDGRRQRLQRDVDHDPERKQRVLFHRPFRPECNGLAQRAIGDVGGAAVEHEQRLVAGDEVADAWHELHDAAGPFAPRA